MEKILTLKKAFEDSITKWIWFSKYSNSGISHYENYDNLDGDLPELKKYDASCGLCEYYRTSDKGGCAKCNLFCLNHDSPYSIWMQNPTTDNAKKMLDVILAEQKTKNSEDEITDLY